MYGNIKLFLRYVYKLVIGVGTKRLLGKLPLEASNL